MVWATFLPIKKSKNPKNPKWPEACFVMVWATFFSICTTQMQFRCMPKPLQNPIEIKQNQKMKIEWKILDFHSNLDFASKTFIFTTFASNQKNMKIMENNSKIQLFHFYFIMSETL